MRWVAISTDNNADYYQYLPIVKKAWNLLGWNTITMTVGIRFEDDEKNKHLSLDDLNLPIRDFSLAQISRLWGWESDFIQDNDIVMTSDIDMMTCTDYWNPKEEHITSYGQDLTNYGQYPMCYIAMKKSKWREVLKNKSIGEVIKDYPHVYTNENKQKLFSQDSNNIWKKYWFVDQEIITDYLKSHTVEKIVRFTNQGIKRIDRCYWEETKNIKGAIDCHLHRPYNKEIAETIFNQYFLNDRNN